VAPRAFPVIYARDDAWGERLAYVADPEGNLVVLAGVGGT
jgi:hypothetical protein